jgi:hypothetical protein
MTTTTISAGSTTFTISSNEATYSLASGLTRGSSGQYQGVYIGGKNDVLLNSGTITAGQADNASCGGVVVYGAGDSVTNEVGGYILGSYAIDSGVQFFGNFGTVTNAGLIVGAAGTVGRAGNGVVFFDGGILTNLSTGTISGNGVYAGTSASTPSTIVNSGVILGGPVYGAIVLHEGGTVTNLAGTIAANGGTYGIYITNAAGTVTNAATINGGVTLATNVANRVIVDPGAVFTGGVTGGTGALELGSGTSTGTLNLTSSSYSGFTSLTLDSGSHWLIKANTSLHTFGTITGFTANDTIQLAGNDTISSQSTGSGLTHVTLTGGSAQTLTFTGTESFQASYSGGVTNLTEVNGPTISVGGSVTFTGSTGGVTPVKLDATASVTDSNSITSATLAITSGFVSGDQLNFNNTLGITGSFNATTGVLTLSGDTSATNYTTALDSVTFSVSPSNVDPTRAGSNPNRTVTWTVVDASGSTSGTSGVITQESSVLNYAGTIQENGILAASETVSGGVMTLKNAGSATVGSITVGTSLSTGNFLVSNNGTNSTIVVDTVFGTYASGITLLTNPTTIAATGKVSNTGGSSKAVSGPTGTNWTLTNLGKVSDAAGIGISFASAGTITNASGGTITALNQAVDLAQGGIVSNASGGVIYGGQGVYGVSGAVTVTNAGSIGGSTTAGGGILAEAGGQVTNQSGGSITGYWGILALNSALTVVNAGHIGGNVTGSGAAGVALGAGGSVTNQSTGTISGYDGVYGATIAATVVNAGSIGSTAASGNGVYLGAGGTVTNSGTISGGADAVTLAAGHTNRVVIDPGAVFTGTVNGGNTIGAGSTSTLELASAASAGTMSGLGTKYTGFAAVTIDSGADWIFSGANTLAHGITLTNSGTDAVIGTLANAGLDTGSSFAVMLGTGGLISNQSGGTISASVGYAITSNGAGTVVNAGSIRGHLGGMYLTALGQVTNLSGGVISGTGMGVRLFTGGTVSNQSGGTISAYYGIFNRFSTVTVINAGLIAGSTSAAAGHAGVYSALGASVTNLSGGSISGLFGVDVFGSPAHVQNAGTIRGAGTAGSLGIGVYLQAGGTLTNQTGGYISGGADAVKFVAGSTGRLVIDPGATFNGTLDGGNTIGASSISTLELASAASTGTLSGFGVQYINFQQVTFDAGAQWVFAGTDSANALGGATLSGFSYGDTIDVTNFVATGSSFSGNHLTLTSGASTISIDIAGNFVTQQFRITNDAGTGTDIILQAPTLHYGDTLAETGFVAASETVNAGQMTLFNSGNTAVGTVGVGTSLSTGEFTLATGGTITGTDIIVNTVFGTYANGITLDVGTTTIASTAKVTSTVTSGNAVTGPGGTAWTLVNDGTVSETASGGIGISLASGGTITNAASAVISAYNSGIYIDGGAGSVSNAGSITGTGTSGTSDGFGIRFGSTSSGGNVTNQSGGVITGAEDGVYFNTLSGAGTVSNAGTIAGGSSAVAGINLSGGGSVSNASSGTITGDHYGVFIANGSTAVVSNAGSIGASVSYGIWLLNGGTVSNASGGTITGGYVTSAAAGVYLGQGGAVTNQSGGWIGGRRGVYVFGGTANVVNAGHIVGGNTTIGAGTADTGAGILLGAGGSVTNQSTGTISGYDGVYAGTLATVVNTGSIAGSNTYVTTVATTVGSGYAYYNAYIQFPTLAAGVFLQAGGVITNLSAGRISGYDGVNAGAAATVVNTGVIAGSMTAATAVSTTVSGGNTYFNTSTPNPGLAAGVFLQAGGSVSNQSGGTISGYDGVKVSGAAGTVVNAGVIAGAYFSGAGAADGVYLQAGGTVTNQATGTIFGRNDGVQIAGGRGTVLNLGTIHSHIGAYGGRGVSLDAGGLIVNGASGGTASTAFIAGYNYAVQFGATGTDTLINYGTIDGHPGTVAVSLTTGTLINGPSGATGALIEAGPQRDAVIISDAATVSNFGTIVGQEYYGDRQVYFGISLAGNGSVASFITNLGTRALITNYVAVYAAQNATITNAGTLAAAIVHGGSADNAVIFGGGTNRLIIDPGAVFVGTVHGSGPVVVTPTVGYSTTLGTANGIGTTTLELASGSAAGTLTGLGVSYVGFAAVTIDAGANWTLAGSNTLGAGITLLDSGTLTDKATFINAGVVTGAATGVILTTGAQVTNQSGGTITGSAFGLTASGASTVVNAGLISSTAATNGDSGVALSGGRLTNQSGGTISGLYGVSSTAVVTLVNSGSISGVRDALDITGGGAITNASGGTITGYRAVNIGGTAAGALVNFGSIGGGAVGTQAAGVQLVRGESATNQSGGLITGVRGIYSQFFAATVTNAGSIVGGANSTASIGVFLQAGGTLTNQSGGFISGIAYAVSLASSHTNRLVIDQGATFSGTVSGGNTIGATSISTLELASSASAGTLTGLGSEYIDFAQVTIDVGAQWSLSGTQSGFATLTNAGTVSNGVTLGSGTLTVNNKSTGTITGTDGIQDQNGVLLAMNTGHISGFLVGVLVQAGGTISNQSGGTITGRDGVYAGTTASAFTVINAGSIVGGAVIGFGVYLGNGGAVTNQSGGLISGKYGVYAHGTATTVVNTGSIEGGSNSGVGVRLCEGGSVTNNTGGTIAGYDGIVSDADPATVTNAGSIGGAASGAFEAGILLVGGGTISNQSSGVISGYVALQANGVAATLVNTGQVNGIMTSHGGGALLFAGGYVDNLSGGTISGHVAVAGYNGALTVKNAGLISGQTAPGYHAGVYLGAGGSITNQSSGTIAAYLGVYARNAAATVVNSGQINGLMSVHGGGVMLMDGGYVDNLSGGTISGHVAVLAATAALTVLNAGVISGQTAVGYHAGIYLGHGGSVTNLSSGTITGFYGIYAQNRAATVINSGSIGGSGPHGIGIDLCAGGTITNAAGGTISGTTDAVYIQKGATGLLVIDPGAVFIGTVDGGNTIGGSHISTLELGSGASAGTLSGLGSKYIDFAQTTIDTGASWIFSGANTVVAGATLTNSGSLTDTGTLINRGTMIGGTAAGTGEAGFIAVDVAGGSLSNQAAVTGGAGAAGSTGGSGGSGAAAVLETTGSVTNLGSITGGVGGGSETTKFGGVGGSGVTLAGGSLTNAGLGTIIGGVGGYGYTDGGAGGRGVNVSGAGLTVVNQGSIVGGAGGTSAAGGIGVSFLTGGTLNDAGYIAGGLGSGGIADAVDFGTGNSRLILDPGATFSGAVVANAAFSDELELASSASAGTISGLGTSITNFTSLVFDAGADWTVAGNDSASGLGTLGIAGFAKGDTIDLTGFVAVSRTFSSNVLVLTDGSNNHETLHIASTLSTSNFLVQSDGNGGTDISIVSPPSITTGGTVTFIGGGSAVALDSSAVVAVNEGSVIAGATIDIASGFVAGDELNFTNTGSITGSFNASDGVLILSGNDTALDYQAALDSITFGFSPSNGDPTAGGSVLSGTIDWIVNDGTVPSNTGTTTLDLVHVAPSIGVSGTVVYAAGGFAAALDPTAAVTDVDSGGMLAGATVSIGSGFLAGDLLTFSNQNGISGSYDGSTGVLTLSGTATLGSYEAALESITYSFTPAPPTGDPTEGNTDNFRTIDWTVTDGSTSNGISTTGTTTVHVVKQPPTITGTVAGQMTTDEAALDPFSGVTIGDPNTGQTETVTITLSNNANGTLGNLGIGFYDSKAGDYVFTGTTLAVTAALDDLVFTPTEHQVVPGNTVTTTFTIEATDDYGVSTTDITTSVLATAVNDPASFTGTLANYGVANQGTSTPFTGLTVVDPDVGHTDTVTITLSNPSFGALSNLDGGVTNNGTYTLTGTPGAVTTAIDGLVLTPNAPSAGVYVTSTTLTVAVTGPGGSPTPMTEVTAAVQQVLGLASVPLNKLAISVSPDGSSFASPVGGDTNEAVITNPGTSSTYTLPTGYQAEFLGGTANATLTDSAVGNAILVGNSGADTISATAVNDSLVGGNGNNFLAGGSGTIAVLAGNGNNVVSVPGGATYTVSLGNGNDTVFADGSGTVTGGTGTNVFAVQSGGGINLINSNGSDTIYTGGTLTNVSVAGSGAFIAIAATGTVNATVTGSATTLVGAGATTNLTSSGEDGFYYVGSSNLNVTESGTADTIGGGSAALTVSAASSSPFVWGGSGNLLVIGGSGTPTVDGGSGGASISGGSGGVVVGGGSGTPTVSGTATLFGASGGLIDYVGSSGTLLYAADGGSDTLDASQSSANDVMLGSNVTTGAALIFTGTGNNTVVGAAGAVTVVATAGALIAGGSGFLEVKGGAGTPTINGGSGQSSILAGSGGADVGAGSGTPTVTGLATLFGGAGSDVTYEGSVGGAIYVAADGAETLNAAQSSTSNDEIAFYGTLGSSQLIIDGSGSNTVLGGAGATTVQATSGSELVAGGSGSLTFIGGSGSAVVYGGTGTASVVGGSGGVTFGGGTGTATLRGTATAYGVAGELIDYTGSSGGLNYLAGTGSETVNAAASSTNNLIWASASTGTSDVMVGGSGNDTLIAGPGANTLTGGAGSNEFIFISGRDGGHATITDLSASDQVFLQNYGAGAALQAERTAVSAGGNTTLTLSDNTQITFLGITSVSALIGRIVSS